MKCPSCVMAVEREEKGEERGSPESTSAKHRARHRVDNSCSTDRENRNH